VSYRSNPPILFLDVSNAPNVHPNHKIQFRIGGDMCRYELKGIIYFGSGHFVSQIVDQGTHVWYHDGIETGNVLTYEGLIADCNFKVCHTRAPTMLAYQSLLN
jgi:hypothetical protein